MRGYKTNNKLIGFEVTFRANIKRVSFTLINKHLMTGLKNS